MHAREEEADEEALERRMELTASKLFAIDFKDALVHGLTPDPSLIVAIAVEATTSFAGLGPTTMKRLKLLIAVMNIANIESDKKILEQIDHDMRAELNLLNSVNSDQGSKRLESLFESFHKDRDAQFDIR